MSPSAGEPAALPATPSQARGVEVVLFATLFVCYGYFHQGGGWNQNSRFDQIRSIAESGELFINRYMIYQSQRGADGRDHLRRVPVPDRVRLEELQRYPLLNSGDVSLLHGRFFPNKPPGTSFLAVPAYWLVAAVERAAGMDRDDLWPLTLAAYGTTVLSVGMLGALGGVIFFRLSRRLFPGVALRSHVVATLAFGLGTMMLPFSTMLFDHVPSAVCSLAAFGLAFGARQRAERREPGVDARLAGAGLLIGCGVLTNYAVLMTAGILLAYVLLADAALRRRAWVYLLGGLLPAVVHLWYHQVCFGSAFTLAKLHEIALFRQPESRWLGVFAAPDPFVLVTLLVSLDRGLFTTAPVMLLGLVGLWSMLPRAARRAEAGVCIAVGGAFLLMNASFNAWHGGSGFGPRYLLPALPFFCIPLAVAIDRRPRVGSVLAGASIILMLLVTAVNPQLPPADRNPSRGAWTRIMGAQSPVTQRVLPLLLGSEKSDPFASPVSANPLGMYEGRMPAVSAVQVGDWAWNSFNLGELICPGSVLSLVPLMVLLAGACAALGWLTHLARSKPRHNQPSGKPAEPV